MRTSQWLGPGRRQATFAGVALAAVWLLAVDPASQAPPMPLVASPLAVAAGDAAVAKAPASADLVGPQAAWSVPEREPTPAAPAAIGAPETVVQLTGEAERIAGVPIALLWSVDPMHQRALGATLLTDAAGRASAHIERGPDQAGARWADLDFPTQGYAAVPLPTEGGITTLPMLLQSFLDVVVVEADGAPPREAATVEVRVPTARSPGERWHRVAIAEGRGRLPVEFGGLELEVRARTASGRTVGALLRGAEAPDAAVECRLTLGCERMVTARVQWPDGTAAAGVSLEVRFADTGRSFESGTVMTDADGLLRLFVPARELRGRAAIELLLHACCSPDDAGARVAAATMAFPVASLGAAVSDLGLVMLHEAPLVAAGRVEGGDGAAAGRRVVLELGRIEVGKGASAEVGYQPLCTARTASDGTFQVRRRLPTAAALRLRCGDGTPVVQAIRPGDADVRLVLPKPRSLFRRR